ncbi:hypothetical protein OUZ56_012972 [Daphnia magna]|uniref:Uncharacterized protein n=1 Tax=Daphnia magna TaxID=35525 RepID=A0ABQ9Z4N3_9CRUS|nr:hypothetical protein OUZ56_012972 [Daphnia magna]
MQPTMLQGHPLVLIQEEDTEDDEALEVIEDKDHLEVVLMHTEKEMLPILKLHNKYGNTPAFLHPHATAPDPSLTGLLIREQHPI